MKSLFPMISEMFSQLFENKTKQDRKLKQM